MAKQAIDVQAHSEHNLTVDDARIQVVNVVDRGGSGLRLFEFEGKLFSPWFTPSRLMNIRDLPIRTDDIYIPSFGRTGAHWTYEMIKMLLKGSAETDKEYTKASHQIEIASEHHLASLPSPRVLLAHVHLSDSPRQVVEKRCKIIYKLRDPKDVAVSLYNLYRDCPTFFNYDGEFKDFLYLFLEGKVDANGIFQHWRDAERFFDHHPDNPVLIQVYEDTIRDPLQEVERLSDFLGLERNDQLCRQIVDKCAFTQMKSDRSEDPGFLYRKGIEGDWRNWFTDELLEDYYRVYEDKMAGSRFYQRYARDRDT